MTTIKCDKFQLGLALCVAALACPSALAGAFSVEGVLATNGTTSMADDFEDAILDPAWGVLSGAPIEAGGLLRIANGDWVVRPTGELAPGAVVTAQVDLSELEPGEFGGLMLLGSSILDSFTVNFTTAGVFFTDENGLLGGLPGDPGQLVTLEILAVGGNVAVGANGSPIYAGGSGLNTSVTGVGFLLVPEPASVALVALGLLALRRRR